MGIGDFSLVNFERALGLLTDKSNRNSGKNNDPTNRSVHSTPLDGQADTFRGRSSPLTQLHAKTPRSQRGEADTYNSSSVAGSLYSTKGSADQFRKMMISSMRT